jgi:hypothetical protein
MVRQAGANSNGDPYRHPDFAPDDYLGDGFDAPPTGYTDTQIHRYTETQKPSYTMVPLKSNVYLSICVAKPHEKTHSWRRSWRR